jgi:hypothetical protein
MAVVAVGPFAMGVRYSVCSLGKSVPGGDCGDAAGFFVFGIQGP